MMAIAKIHDKNKSRIFGNVAKQTKEAVTKVIEKLTNPAEVPFSAELSTNEIYAKSKAFVLLEAAKHVDPEGRKTYEILEAGIAKTMLLSTSKEGHRAEQLTRIAQSQGMGYNPFGAPVEETQPKSKEENQKEETKK